MIVWVHCFRMLVIGTALKSQPNASETVRATAKAE